MLQYSKLWLIAFFVFYMQKNCTVGEDVINLENEKRSGRGQEERGPLGSDIIAGRNAVNEALRSGREIDSLYVQRGNRTGPILTIIAKAKDNGIVIKEADVKKLDYMCGGSNHQGIVAVAAIKEFSSLDDIFALAEERGEAPFIIICDELEDPHNLGAILRTAECAGAHGVIIPKRRSVGLTYAVGKASAGAVEYVPVVRVTNIVNLIQDLKDRGVWIYAADVGGQNWCEVNYSGSTALIIGSEGNGIGRLIKEKSDFVVTVPLKGKINSLNASVAAGILCFEIARQRADIKSINP